MKKESHALGNRAQWEATMNPADTATALSAVQWLHILGLGALLGAAGQVVRMIVGLKKLAEAAKDASRSTADCIEPSRMVVSIVIGATAGALASIGVREPATEAQLFTLAAAGYSGADFIEGLTQRVSPASTSAVAGSDAAASDDAVG
jgi:hypothetical protein